MLHDSAGSGRAVWALLCATTVLAAGGTQVRAQTPPGSAVRPVGDPSTVGAGLPADEVEAAELADEAGDGRVTVHEKGTSSRAARKTALAAVPLDKFTPENRRRAEEILGSISLFRQLPTVSFEVEPGVYQYFISCPEVAVSIWRAMGISKFQMWQTGSINYEADAGDGTTGAVEVLHRSHEHNVVLCEGVFKSPLIAKPIQARALLHLQTAFERDAAGKGRVRHQLSMFVNFPSQSVETAARLISPVSNIIVDRNFREISLFVHLMSLAMERQPGWVERIAGKMEGIPEVRRTQFLKLTAQTYIAARKRELEALEPGSEVSVDDIVGALKVAPAETSASSAGVPRIAASPAGSAQ